MTAWGCVDCACFEFADQVFPDVYAQEWCADSIYDTEHEPRKPIFLAPDEVRRAFDLFFPAMQEVNRSMGTSAQRGRRYFSVHLGDLHVLGFKA